MKKNITKSMKQYKLTYDGEIIAISSSRDDLYSMRDSFVRQGVAELKEMKVKLASSRDVSKFSKPSK